jgi:hypothetical protein
VDAAADAGAGFKHGHGVASVSENPGSSEAGQASPDHKGPQGGIGPQGAGGGGEGGGQASKEGAAVDVSQHSSTHYSVSKPTTGKRRQSILGRRFWECPTMGHFFRLSDINALRSRVYHIFTFDPETLYSAASA